VAGCTCTTRLEVAGTGALETAGSAAAVMSFGVEMKSECRPGPVASVLGGFQSKSMLEQMARGQALRSGLPRGVPVR
jgi:hypothetical protein